MAKKQNRKNKGLGFALFMILYALVALVGIFLGLKWFWGFMEAYELSRPSTVIDAYMQELTKDHILEECGALLDQVDVNIQTEEECMDHLRQTLKGDITYARKASACTDREQTYVLRCGSRVIGSFVIETTTTDRYGFTPWTFREEHFDLSWLMGNEAISVTVPQGYLVAVNNKFLDESYILEETRLEYELLKDFSDSYELPELVMYTYQAGPFLNAEFEMTVYDPNGNVVVMDENFDVNSIIALTDQDQIEKLDSFLEVFISRYVQFSGSANGDPRGNYRLLMAYVVPGSKLQQRMDQVLDGMQYAQSRGDKVADIYVNHYIALPEDRYMLDVTYKVDTSGRQGVVQTTTNVKMIVVSSGENLLVESMIGY